MALSSPVEYPIPEFEVDFLHFCSGRPRVDVQALMMEVKEYFERRLGKGMQSSWRMKRLVAAVAFLEFNRGKLGSFLLVSEMGMGASISPALVRALAVVYTTFSDAEATPFFPCGRMLDMAQRIKAQGGG